MKTVTIRDLRTRPKQVRDSLRGEREAVLTANGRPVAVLIPVDASSVDETLETLRRAQALTALRALSVTAGSEVSPGYRWPTSIA